MRRIGIGMIGAGAELDRYLETGLLRLRGEKEPFMPGLEGFRDLAVVDAARRSIRLGCAEAVEEF